MMVRRDRMEQIGSFAYGPAKKDHEAVAGQTYCRELIEMLAQRIDRHLRDMDMWRTHGWYRPGASQLSVEGESSFSVEKRMKFLEYDRKLLNELGEKGQRR